MERCSIVIQGEGKGHFSQALAAIKILEKNQVDIVRVYIGKSLFKKIPSYFSTSLSYPIKTFYSPNFLRTVDRKGILIFQSILINLLFSPVYLYEATRIGILMRLDRSGYVFNFYDPIGGLAGKYWKRRSKRIVLSHHFYLSHSDFMHPHGFGNSYFWLGFMNRYMAGSVNTVFALSFRKGEGFAKTEVIPPLLDGRIKENTFIAGSRDLCYFLNPGYVEEIIDYYRKRPELEADIFTGLAAPGDLPGNVTLHKPSREKFLNAMYTCRRMITSAGFDTVAEAFYLGIPIIVIPTGKHYEQYCNALDAARTGMAFHLDQMLDLDELDFEPTKNNYFRSWVDENESFETWVKQQKSI